MDLGDDLSTWVDALMDGLVADLERLTAIPSIAFPGFRPEPVQEAHDLLVDLLNLRFHPAQDPREARDRLVTHLESLRPSGIPLTVAPGDTGPGFEPATDGPAYRAARTALREGWGSEPAFVASGGSIPWSTAWPRRSPVPRSFSSAPRTACATCTPRTIAPSSRSCGRR